MTTTISPRFVRGMQSLINHWHKRTTVLNDKVITALNQDYANLLRLVKYGLVLPETRLATAKLILQTLPLIERCGYWETWLPILEELVTQLDEHPTIQIRLLNRLGQLERLTQQLDKALSSHQQALQLAEALGETLYIAHIHFQLSADHRLNRDYAVAEIHGLQAKQLFEQNKTHIAELASALNTLGLIALQQGNLETATQQLTEAITYWQETAQTTELARTLNSLAMVQHRQKAFTQAQQTYQEAIALAEQTITRSLQIQLYLNLASLYFDWKQLEEAERVFQQANERLNSYSGTLRFKATVMQGLGNVALHQKQFRTAEVYLRHSLDLWQKMSDQLMLANTVGTLAEVIAAQNRSDEAKTLYDQALTLLSYHPENSWAKRLTAEFLQQRDLLN